MKVIKKLVSVFLITFVSLGVLFEARASSENPISLQIENLTRWKSSPEAAAIKQSLRAILEPRPNYLRSPETLKELKQYTELFRKPFLLLQAEENGLTRVLTFYPQSILILESKSLIN